MSDSLVTMQHLLDDIQVLMKSNVKADRREAIGKLRRLGSLAATLALTLVCLKT